MAHFNVMDEVSNAIVPDKGHRELIRKQVGRRPADVRPLVRLDRLNRSLHELGIRSSNDTAYLLRKVVGKIREG